MESRQSLRAIIQPLMPLLELLEEIEARQPQGSEQLDDDAAGTEPRRRPAPQWEAAQPAHRGSTAPETSPGRD